MARTFKKIIRGIVNSVSKCISPSVNEHHSVRKTEYKKYSEEQQVDVKNNTSEHTIIGKKNGIKKTRFKIAVSIRKAKKTLLNVWHIKAISR